MYASFYGLRTPAFQLTPDPSFFFDSPQHKRAMAHLTYGLHHAEGFIVITGEVGAGKTMLVDRLLLQIDPTSYVTAKIVTTLLEGDDLLRLVASGFGLNLAGMTKAMLLTRIQEFVTAQYEARRRAVLIVDEAQNLTFEALEELRMLSNIIVGKDTALQSFLLGQPQFRGTLGSPAFDQLRQRITAAYHLGPLGEEDSRAYIEHRLSCAGWNHDPQFADECFPIIYRHTGGIPRRINSLCTRLLLFGFLEESHNITADDTERVAADLRAELLEIAAPQAANTISVRQEAAWPEALGARLHDVERSIANHDRTIRRMVTTIANHFRRAEADGEH
jgi:putative secretion ATPase (PEP-CTERM system associated)